VPDGSSYRLSIVKKRMGLFTDKATIVASLPYDPRLAATLPKPDAPTWIRWLRAQGGTSSKLGILRDGDQKLPIRLDDEGDCQIDYASSKDLDVRVGAAELKGDKTFGGGKTTCAKVLDHATFEFTKDGDREWLDVPLLTEVGKTVGHFRIDRQTAEEFLQKRVNRMIAQKTAFGSPVITAQRVLFRDTDKQLTFWGAVSPIDLIAVASIKAERSAPDCEKIAVESKAENATAPPKSLKRVFIDLDVAIYWRNGAELGRSTFEGGATGCPKSVAPGQISQTIRDGADRAAIHKWVARYVANSGGVDLRSK
jgi:hypothetical protein